MNDLELIMRELDTNPTVAGYMAYADCLLENPPAKLTARHAYHSRAAAEIGLVREAWTNAGLIKIDRLRQSGTKDVAKARELLESLLRRHKIVPAITLAPYTRGRSMTAHVALSPTVQQILMYEIEKIQLIIQSIFDRCFPNLRVNTWDLDRSVLLWR